MKRLIIANWKMNFSFEEAKKFSKKLEKDISYKDNIIIAAPAPYLAYLANNFKSIKYASQNVSSFKEYGSYSGEYNARMLKNCGINYVLIGHYERRKFFHEDNIVILEKIKNSVEADIIPIICIGESLEIRQNNLYKEFIKNEIENLAKANPKEIIIAYEPIWSIGTGILPNHDQLDEIFHFIEDCLKKSALEEKAKLLYGGSADLENIEKILEIDKIKGILLGRPSLDYEKFVKILSLSL